jgi:hypothetical protein
VSDPDDHRTFWAVVVGMFVLAILLFWPAIRNALGLGR